MKKLIGAMTLMFCITAGISEATVENVRDDGSYEVGPSGCIN